MCVHQAADAFRHFTGWAADLDRMRRRFASALAQRSESNHSGLNRRPGPGQNPNDTA